MSKSIDRSIGATPSINDEGPKEKPTPSQTRYKGTPDQRQKDSFLPAIDAHKFKGDPVAINSAIHDDVSGRVNDSAEPLDNMIVEDGEVDEQ